MYTTQPPAKRLTDFTTDDLYRLNPIGVPYLPLPGQVFQSDRGFWHEMTAPGRTLYESDGTTYATVGGVICYRPETGNPAHGAWRWRVTENNGCRKIEPGDTLPDHKKIMATLRSHVPSSKLTDTTDRNRPSKPDLAPGEVLLGEGGPCVLGQPGVGKTYIVDLESVPLTGRRATTLVFDEYSMLKEPPPVPTPPQSRQTPDQPNHTPASGALMDLLSSHLPDHFSNGEQHPSTIPRWWEPHLPEIELMAIDFLGALAHAEACDSSIANPGERQQHQEDDVPDSVLALLVNYFTDEEHVGTDSRLRVHREHFGRYDNPTMLFHYVIDQENNWEVSDDPMEYQHTEMEDAWRIEEYDGVESDAIAMNLTVAMSHVPPETPVKFSMPHDCEADGFLVKVVSLFGNPILATIVLE